MASLRRVDDEQERKSCDVCGRSMLYGERTREYATPDGARRAVCDLCRTRARRAGWVRADRAARGTATPREPERPRRARARERFARSIDRVRPREAPQSDGEQGEPAAQRPAEPEDSPERRIRRAIERFNETEHRRTVAGLNRSLGVPRVAAVTPAEAPEQVRLTVAWDLSWYQWKVEFGERKPVVHAFRNGKEVSELGPADRAWNAHAGQDGRLQLRLGASREREAPARDTVE